MRADEIRLAILLENIPVREDGKANVWQEAARAVVADAARELMHEKPGKWTGDDLIKRMTKHASDVEKGTLQ